MLQLDFSGQLNSSLQIGDIVYYLPVTTTAGFNLSNTNSAVELGPVTQINRTNFNDFTIMVDTTQSQPPSNSFFMFSKDNTVNLASVLGYHAEVQFVNNSSKKAEMFSVGSIIQLNSK
tara:strand:- start:171 stop:524 length:354 start_codon:yes stop_codon:yes gene_type:complete